MNQIVICKLTDGSLAIGQLTGEGISDAVEVRVHESAEQGFGIQFVPLLFPFNTDLKESFTIRTSSIIVSIKAPEELSNQYWSNISPSGIIPASYIPEAIKKGHGLSIVK